MGIVQIVFCCYFQHFVEVFGCFPSGFGEIPEEVVAAVARGLSWDVAFVGSDEGKCFLYEGKDVGRGEVATQEEIVACETSHGTPVDDAVAPCGMVAQEGGGKVFDGMEG